MLAVYSGGPAGALRRIAHNDNESSSNCCHSRLRIQAVAGTTYSIAVQDFFLERGDIRLNLEPQPPNDTFADAIELRGSSAAAAGRNWGATREPGKPDHASEWSRASIWYRWTAPADGRVTVDTAGSNFDTLLAVYTGETVNALSAVGANDNSDDTPQSRVEFSASAGTTYRIAVDGDRFAEGDVVLHLAQDAPAPTGPPARDQPVLPPPAGAPDDRLGGGHGRTSATSAPPAVHLRVVGRRSRSQVLARGLRLAVGCNEPCGVSSRLLLRASTARRLGLGTRRLVVGAAATDLPAGHERVLTIRLRRSVRRALARARSAPLVLRVRAVDGSGDASSTTRTIRLR